MHTSTVQQQAVSLATWRPRLAVAATAQSRQQRHKAFRLQVSCASQGTGGPSSAEDFARKAAQFAASSSAKFEEWARENQLKEKAERITDQVSRRAQEVFDEADKKMSLRTRLRNAYLSFREQAPRVQRELAAFAETPVGRVVLVLVGLWALSSGLLLRLLNFMFLLLWLAPLFLPLVARYVNKKAMEEASEFNSTNQRGPRPGGFGGFTGGWPGAQQQQQQQQQRRQPSGGFGGFGNFGGGFGNGKGSGGSSKWDQQPGGPVIDAEWEPVDKK